MFAKRKRAEKAVRELITYLGDNPDRPGLAETPRRFLDAWDSSWGAGYSFPNDSDLVQQIKLFPGEGNPQFSEMIVERDIMVYSHCEHHITPFFGRAHVAYIPDKRGLLGLSKLAKIVNHFARRLQVQERLTDQIASFMAEHVSEDVGVMLTCQHMCMMSRGVMQPNASTRTTSLRGAFHNEPETRQEFLAACR